MVWHVGNWTVFVFASVVAGFSASVQDDLRTDCNVKYIISGLGDFGDQWCGTLGSDDFSPLYLIHFGSRDVSGR